MTTHSTTMTPEQIYDLTKSGAIYFAPAGRTIPLDPELLAIVEAAHAAEPDDSSGEEPFGSLADGTPIVGVVDPRDPSGRAGIVHAQWGDWELSADDDGYIGFSGPGFQSPDTLHLSQLAALRALLAADCLDQLAQVAVAYGRGDAAPPAPATSSCCYCQGAHDCAHCDNGERIVTRAYTATGVEVVEHRRAADQSLAWTYYRMGDVEIAIESDASMQLTFQGTPIGQELHPAALQRIQTDLAWLIVDLQLRAALATVAK